MELPIELRNAIEERLQNLEFKQLQKDAENISLRYRNESGNGKRLLTENTEAVSYSVVRMPATYSAIYSSLSNTLDIFNGEINSLLDVGAGTGAGSWAASNLIELKHITCLEREDAMVNLGKSLMLDAGDYCLVNAEWKKFDLVNNEINECADLVICSYVLNEMDEVTRNKIVDKLWQATKKVLLIVEPGTPVRIW